MRWIFEESDFHIYHFLKNTTNEGVKVEDFIAFNFEIANNECLPCDG